MLLRTVVACLGLFLGIFAAACGAGGRDALILGATTSVQDTGLLDEIMRAFEKDTGYTVTPVVGGSGQILEMARRGEVDVILTHSPDDEQRLVADGEGVDRRPVMENYFVIAGPSDDPAGVGKVTTLREGFEAISRAGHAFISRGDSSGTHKRELSIWREAGVDPHGESWYKESASGQGQSLLLANEMAAYTLVDSSTFTVFDDRIDLVSLTIDRDRPNVYSVTRVNPDKHPNVNTETAIALANFLTSVEGRCLIANFGVSKYGEALFSTACPRSNTGG